MNDWQPIKTAPLGKWILLKGGQAENSEDIGPIVSGFGDKYTKKDGWYVGCCDGFEIRYIWPTHWKEIE